MEPGEVYVWDNIRYYLRHCDDHSMMWDRELIRRIVKFLASRLSPEDRKKLVASTNPVVHLTDQQTLTFHCPGCGKQHYIAVGIEPHQHKWNWSLEAPTLMPSVIVQSDGETTEICQFTLENGYIKFLPHSTHSLVDQKVRLPVLPK